MHEGRDGGPVVVADVVVSVGVDEDVVDVDDVSCRGKMAPKAVVLDSAMKIRARFTERCIVGVSVQRSVGSEIWVGEEIRDVAAMEAKQIILHNYRS
jgi:hypothetical protein